MDFTLKYEICFRKFFIFVNTLAFAGVTTVINAKISPMNEDGLREFALAVYYNGFPESVLKTHKNSLQYSDEMELLAPPESFFDCDKSHRDVEKSLEHVKKFIHSAENFSEKYCGEKDESVAYSMMLKYVLSGQCKDYTPKQIADKLYPILVRNSGKYKNNHEYIMSELSWRYMNGLPKILYAYMLYRGIGVPKDEESATIIVDAFKGTKFWKGFYCGYIVPEDKEFAIFILKRSAAQGHKDSIEFLKKYGK